MVDFWSALGFIFMVAGMAAGVFINALICASIARGLRRLAGKNPLPDEKI